MFYYTGGVTTNGSSAVYGATSGHVRTNYQGRVSHPTSLGQLRIKAGRNNSQNVFMCRWCKHDLDCRGLSVRMTSVQRICTLCVCLLMCSIFFLQWQNLADCPLKTRCYSCVTCRRNSDPISSSSPTLSAMRPDYSRLVTLNFILFLCLAQPYHLSLPH